MFQVKHANGEEQDLLPSLMEVTAWKGDIQERHSFSNTAIIDFDSDWKYEK